MWLAASLGLLGCPFGCGDSLHPIVADASPDVSVDGRTPVMVRITATVNSTRFVTREHMLAAGEMQISGEPLAEAMGRTLADYSRDLLPADIYYAPRQGQVFVDLAGFSSGVESYEYSKQPMNNLAFEAGAGTSLVHAALVNTDSAIGTAATAHLAARVQHFATGSNAQGKWVFPAGTFPVNNPLGDTNPAGVGVAADNPLGWPGIWPTAHVYRSFDPAIDPTSAVDLRCSISSDDSPDDTGQQLICADYECNAATLHLRNRAAQLDRTITPGADGFSGWKYGLWLMNYLQIMHDANEGPVALVSGTDLASVGAAGNQVVGDTGTGMPTTAGTYLGSSDIEGFQAQMFILELDSRADDWLARLTTTNGTSLSGFATRAAALAYDYTTPLRWFPGEIAVIETNDGSGFPKPAYTLGSANSGLLDLIGLALGYAELYAITDAQNGAVGGAQTARTFFDGDPFPADNQRADGESTVHDRALAMMRVAVIDLDRLHTDPATGVLVDDVTMTGTTPSRGHTVSTISIAYALLGSRTVLRSLSSQLELYSNNTPDTAIAVTPLDGLPIHYPNNTALTFTGRLAQIVRTHANLLLDHLTAASGRAWAGWNVETGTPIDDADVLDAHTAAIRGLFAAYLATGDVRYRTRAIAVFDRVEAVFYDPDARIYSTTAAPVDSVEYTPLRFALLQSALRDVYELVATRPGNEILVPIIEDRIGRLNKLVLNGWDDRDRDKTNSWPDECVNIESGLPRGGLQMAERTLTGEVGRAKYLPTTNPGPPTTDREEDCVPEVDDARLPAALADSITFHLTRDLTRDDASSRARRARRQLDVARALLERDHASGGTRAVRRVR